jgi:hypothetical protein
MISAESARKSYAVMMPTSRHGNFLCAAAQQATGEQSQEIAARGQPDQEAQAITITAHVPEVLGTPKARAPYG